MAPKVIAKNADRTGGVLPINAAARTAPVKQTAARLKVEVRRLPPGLTLTEFEETLGEEWKVGNGKVNWREYRPGKTRLPSTGKVSEQSRCYLHLVNDTFVREFEKRFLDVVFHDKAGTHRGPELKYLLPTLGFAPNQRTPLQQGKPRADNRQGTIDQDPEFISFLEAETQPISKPAAIDSNVAEKENVEIKSTPLIDDLRERKANKAKAAQAKAEKEKEKKAQAAAKSGTKESTEGAQKEGSAKQKKAEQVAKEVAKVTNKQASGKQQNQVQQTKAQAQTSAKTKKQANMPSPKPQNATPTQPASPAPSGPSNTATQRQRQRGNTDGIKKMLQKDLGIKPKAQQQATSQTTRSSDTSATSTTATQPSATTSNNQRQQQQPAKAAVATPPNTSEPSSSDAKTPTTKAYLKHANPSQGMTEVLIQSALAEYGPVTSVTIDPRKGTAIAVFADVDGLKKALGAKRVPVAKGAVEMLEFRDRSAAGASRGGFKGGRGGRGGGGGRGATSATTGTANAAPQQQQQQQQQNENSAAPAAAPPSGPVNTAKT